ncbi:hypothetical protein [Microbispora sp. GKU 823]|uniref:hypothetical protein n=1 Tax=Microbispora sp. GKU 823 TaxID=1652100 RepID=UPI0009A445A9|nr:hypothetical protein [Microbispora sp. GKU 823]OPG13697.1 hypothetical protein B1L11_06840 [Microbispora sp. GKU 823]
MTETLPQRAECPTCKTKDVQVNQTGRLRKHKHNGDTCPGSGAPIGTARIPKPARGWYTDPVTGTKLRRVTSILERGVPKPALPYWAGNLVAETAMEHLPQLVRASRRPHTATEAYDWLRRAHTRKKDERADIGDAVHQIIEAHVLETPVPQDLLDNPEMRPYLENFLAFVRDYEVTFEASEMVVGSYEHGYAGKLDYILHSPYIHGGRPSLGDTKTGGELDVRLADGTLKGVYPEAGMQMSAYRHAEVCWLRDGTRLPMPETHDVGVVLHLRPEGYRVYPVKCGPEVFAKFLHALQVAEWSTELAPTVVGAALPIPTRVRQAQEVA